MTAPGRRSSGGSRRGVHSFVLVAAVAILSAAEPMGGEATATIDGEVAFKTAYQETPVAGARTIRLRGRLGGTGVFSLDPNACELDAFGNPARCTQIAWKEMAVEFRPVGVSPGERPTGWRLFNLVGSPPPGFHLVVAASPNGPHRLLVLDDRGGIDRVIGLEPMS